MSLTPSNMLALGTHAPDFTLPNTLDPDVFVSPSTYATHQPLLIAFICNHCPYVIHIIEKFVAIATHYQQQGIPCIAISSNDVTTHPEDSPKNMHEFARLHHFPFPYCYDENQAVAQSYLAACTPDFYLFNKTHQLVYRGRFDAATPGNDMAVTGEDLERALRALIDNKAISTHQHPSMGCNIKWK